MMQKMTRKYALVLSVLLMSTAGTAQNIEFGKIGDKDAFKQHWQLDDDEMARYQKYMDVAGRFRHQNVDPLTVLSMIAKDKEDKLYYAKKAAEYEHNAVKAEIETSWLISEAMSVKRLEDDMQRFTDALTGIDTIDYIPYTERTHWQPGDEWVVLVNEHCRHKDCLSQYLTELSALPSGVAKKIIVKDGPLADEVTEMFNGIKEFTISNYDPIEHAFLGDQFNQPLHVRQRNLLGLASKTTAQDSQTEGKKDE